VLVLCARHPRRMVCAMPAQELVKILSIDGGGIRGIIPALILAEIERQTERPACELFDLIAGTSTGGIIALGVTVPGETQPDGESRPRWSARELADMYSEDGPEIFHRSLVRTIETVDGLLVEKYAAKGLEALLERCLGDVPLSRALSDVLITSYDIHKHEPFFFKSFLARPRPRVRTPDGGESSDPAGSALSATGADALMRVVGRATSAAPTYFEPEHVLASVSASLSEYVLVDGGTFANNPAMCAYAEARRNHPGAEVMVVSLGTGRLTESISFEHAKHWGLAQWAHPLVGVMMDGSSTAIDYQLDELLGVDEGHFRFQSVLEGASDSLDDVSAKNIAGLRHVAETFIAENEVRIKTVCARLTSS
jgi:uncharacterized protein